MNQPYTTIEYDIDDFPFPACITNALNVENLSLIHKQTKNHKLLRKNTEQLTEWHQKYYSAIDHTEFGETFQSMYKEFLLELSFDFPGMMGEPCIVYQSIPTLRVHLPNNVAVSEYHRDRDYNHPRSEFNVFLPLTKVERSNTIWVETAEGREDFKPIEITPGEIAIFKGCDLLHGNHLNTSKKTRVSLDFRYIPFSQYQKSEERCPYTGKKFEIGSYYEVLEI